MKRIILSLILLLTLLFANAQQTPDCQAPENLTISNLTATSVTLNWGLSAGHDAPTVYTLTLKDKDRNVISQDNALSAPFLIYDLTGLTANTTYIVELTGNCNASSSGYSTTATITFSTLCGPTSAPYIQNFDTLTVLPTCTYSSNATISYSARYGKGLALHATISEGAYFVFPELSLNSNMVECSLWLKSSTVAEGNIPVQIGLITDPADVGSSFEPLYSGTLTDLNWKEIQMNTSATLQPVISSAMIAVNIPAGFDTYVYIDDVSIHQVPTCIRPENFTISDISSTTATLDWTTTNAANSRIYISSSEGSTSVLASSNPYTLTNLTPNTEYTLTLRGICSATDSSELCRQTITFTTKCDIASTPLFHETFDTLSVPNTIPVCWETGWMVKTKDVDVETPFTSTTYQVHTGTRAMKLQPQPTGTSSYLSSQLLPVNAAGQYTLSVWVYRQNASQYQMEALRFWASPNYDSTTGATLLGTVPLHFLAAPAETTANMWYNYEYVIPSAGNYYIIVEGLSETGAAIYFDDIEVKQTPSCMKVSNIRLSNPSSYDVDLLWTPGNTETQWAVNYTLTQNAAIVSTVSDTVTAATLNIPNLTPATVYSITGSIRALCSGGDTSVAASFSQTFTTTCLPISTFPYVCGFEASERSAMANPLPLCWQRRNDAQAIYNFYPNATSSADLARTGSGYLRFFPTSSTLYNYGTYQMALLPDIDTTYQINTLRLTFYARTEEAATSHKFLIGVITDPDDISTFTTIDSFPVYGVTYKRHEILFDSYTGSGRYLALMVRRAEYGRPVICIDDLVIDEIPSCRDIAGTGVEVSDITDVAARLTVTDATATTWEYAYGVAGTPVATLTPTTTTSTNIYITNLLPSTVYSVYARRICGSEVGNWCDAVNFTTACPAASTPFYEDFESHTVGTLRGCFVVESGNSEDSLAVFSSTEGAPANSSYNHTAAGSKGISSSDGTVNSFLTSNMSAFAYVHLEAGRNYEVSLYAKKYNDSFTDYSYHLTFNVGLILSNLSPVGYHDVTGNHFERYASTFTVPTSGNYYVGFNTTANATNPEYYPYIDDIRIEEIACTSPSNVIVSDLTSSSVVLNINSSASAWQVAVSAFPINIENEVTGDVMLDTVSSPYVSITGLRPNADYYYTVRSLCANGETSAWMSPGSFHTRCTTMNIPYFEGFENVGSTDCWASLGGSGSAGRSTELYHTGNASMRASNISLLSPQANVISFAPYMFSAWVYSRSTATAFSVGVMNDPDDPSSFELIQSATLPAANKWIEINVPFSILNDPEYSDFYNARYLLISFSGDSALYIDDINIEDIPTCAKPTNSTISNVTGTDATIDWTEAGSATQWRVRLVPANGQESTVDVTTHPYTLTGLNPSSLYTVYVSALCSQADQSSETNIGQFRTSCGVITAPYSEDFELQTVKTTPACWSITGSTVYLSAERDWGVHQISGNRSIRMSNWGLQNGDALINSPEIYIPAGQNFELSYDYTHQATNGPLMVKIRRSGETAFTTLASHANSGESTSEDNLPIRFHSNTVSLAAYAGDTVTIQFFSTADDIAGEGAIFVDNVKVRVYNPCSYPALSLKTLSDVEAQILITDTIHTSWQYAYGPQNFDITSVQPATTMSKTISLTGLSSATSYDICVRSDCGSGLYSEWQRFSFRTTFPLTAIPYSTDFSNPADNDLWIKEGDAVNAFVFGTDPNALINSTHALYVSSDGIHYDYNVDVNSMACISRLFNFEEEVYDIEFDWQCPGGKSVLNGVVDYGRFYLMPAYADPLPQGTGMYYKYYFWDEGIIPLDGNTHLELIPGKQHASALVDMTGRAGAYRLVFFWFTENGGGQSHYPLSVANLSVQEVTCDPVQNLVVPQESITDNSAYVHCNNSTSSLRWVISTSPLLTDSVISGASSTDTFTIHGLNPSTRYYLFVRSECSSTDLSPWSNTTFYTQCGPITNYPHTEDFEETSFPPYCWSNSGWSRYANKPYQYAHGGGCAHAGFQPDQNLVSPELMFDADRQYYLSFWLLRSNLSYQTDQCKVYLSPSTSLNDATLLQSYMTFDPSVSSEALVYYKIDLPEGLSGIYHIIFSAIASGSYQTVYVDDVTFGIYPLCRELKNAPSVVAHTSTTVTLTSDRNNYTSTQYGVAPYSSNVTPADIVTIVDTSYITGLTPNTSYSVFARGICSFCDDTTAWSPALKVTTRTDDCFAPDGLSFITQTSDTMAAIQWNPVPNVSQYEVILSSAVGSDTFFTASNSMTLSPLVQNTAYTFAIRCHCSAIEITEWSVINFNTLNTPALIPYHTGFEPTDDNSLWREVTSAFSNFNIGTDGGGRHSGNQGLYMSTDGNTYSQTYPDAPGTANVYGSAYITRTLFFHEAGNYEVSFDWKSDPISSNTYGYFDAYGRVFIAPVDANLAVDASTYATAYPQGSIEIASKLTGSQTWQRSSYIINVPEAGYRDIVFQWYSFNKYGSAEASDLSDYPLAVDNLDVERIYCLSVNSLTTATYSDSTAVVAVDRSVPVGLEYALLTVNNEDSISDVFSVDADTIRLSGLTPETTYYLFVRQVCDTVYSSSWRSVSFRTTNAPAVLPYICNFEDTDENNRWLFAQNQQNQFVIGSSAFGDGSRSLYVSSDGSSNTYNNTAQSYAYATRTFYLTPGDYYCSYDWRCQGEQDYDYARLFFFPENRAMPVGSYLMDLSYSTLPYSAIAVDGGSQLAGVSSMTNAEYMITVEKEGSYNLVASWQNDLQGGLNTPFVLDNINIHKTSCYAPTVTVINDLQVEGISSVVLSSNNSGMDVVYAVSPTDDFSDAVLSDTIHGFSGRDTLLLTGISSATAYYFLCRSVCSADDYSVKSSTRFTTPCGLVTNFPYRESFESVSTTYISGMISSLCWTAYGASAASAGNPRYQASTTASNVSDGTRSLQLVAHRTNALTLALPEMADISALRLSFDVVFPSTKNMATLEAGYLTDPSDASTFVAVTTTAAATSFTNYVVSFTGAPAGSAIAFRYVGGNTNGKFAYLDNVNVYHIVDGDSFTDTVCYSDGYTEHGFAISADSIPVGLSVHTRTIKAAVSSNPDTLVTLTLLKRPEALLTFHDTICGGQSYVTGIWNIPNPQTRRYHQVFQGASQFGCDSIVELFLQVIPASNIIRDSICAGEYYQFGTQIITTTGTYIRTYQTTHGCTATDTLYLYVVPDTVVTNRSVCQDNVPYRWNGQNYYFSGQYFTTVTGPHGCSQTAELNLTVFAADTTLNASLCTGGMVHVIDTFISAPGTYVIRRISTHGCDVNYHINVTETPIVPENVYDYACEGRAYSGYGISSLVVTADTVVTINTRSLDNLCDSIANIHIMYVETVHTDTFATIPAGSSITWHNQTLSQAGDYQDRLYSEVTGCDSIVTLHLSIGEGVENVSNVTVSIVPNPLTAGATAYLYGNYDEVVMVEILNSLGQRIDAFTPQTYPVEVSGITVSGLYYVRLTTADGHTFVQKLIVE